VDYFNNKVICDLVEAQHTGVLAILDEACLNVGKVTDKVSQSHLGFFTSFRHERETQRECGNEGIFQFYKMGNSHCYSRFLENVII